MECTIYCSSVVRAEARRFAQTISWDHLSISFSLSKAEMIASKNRDSSWVCRNQRFGIPQLMFGSCHIWSRRHTPSPPMLWRGGCSGTWGTILQKWKKKKKKKKELFYRELREKQNLYSHGWIRRHVLLRLDYRCQLLYQLWPTKVMGNVMSSHGGAVDGMPLIWDL